MLHVQSCVSSLANVLEIWYTLRVWLAGELLGFAMELRFRLLIYRSRTSFRLIAHKPYLAVRLTYLSGIPPSLVTILP